MEEKAGNKDKNDINDGQCHHYMLDNALST